MNMKVTYTIKVKDYADLVNGIKAECRRCIDALLEMKSGGGVTSATHKGKVAGGLEALESFERFLDNLEVQQDDTGVQDSNPTQ